MYNKSFCNNKKTIGIFFLRVLSLRIDPVIRLKISPMTLNIGSNADPYAYRLKRYDDDDYVMFLERGPRDSSDVSMSFTKDGRVGVTVPDPVTTLHMYSPSDAEDMDMYLGSNSDLGYRMHKTNAGHLDFLQGTFANGSNVARLTSDGRVGIGTTAPATRLQVNGDTTHHGRIIVMDGQDGGSDRGLYMMSGSDSEWAIYMATAGAGKSPAEGSAVGGSNFDGAALRVRVADSPNTGFILENSSENRLMSVRGNDGLVRFEGPVSFEGGLELGDNISVNRIVFNPEGNDPYFLEKLGDGMDDHELRLTLNDSGAEETFQIWGTGAMRHTFDAGGCAHHTSNLSVGGDLNASSNVVVGGYVGVGVAAAGSSPSPPQHEIDVQNVSGNATVSVKSQQHAGVKLEGFADAGTAAGGGAFLSLATDASGSSNGVLSRVVQAGERGDGGSYTDTLASTTLLGTTDPTTLQFGTNGSVRATFDSNGNLGINKTSPTATLDVVGDTEIAGLIRIRDSNIDSITNAFGAGGGQGSLFVQDSVDDNKKLAFGWDGANDAAVLQSFWETNSATPMWINPAGGVVQLGQSTLSVVGSNVGIEEMNPAYRLHVNGDIYSTGAITSLSDARVKTDLRRIESAMARVAQLKGYRYKRSDTRTNEQDNVDHIVEDHIGFIAQDMLDTVPEAVSYNRLTDRYSVNYGCLTALLAEAINDLSRENGMMRAVITGLTSRVEKLETAGGRC